MSGGWMDEAAETIDWSELPEQCEECETRGANCPLHSGPEWREDEAWRKVAELDPEAKLDAEATS